MEQSNKLMRIVAYCRVSTDKDDQINSLESQKKYFTEYINRNLMWELVEIYADEGVTGTSTKKRRAFNKMIEDAYNHKFDMIITKEISRFARNTLDSIYFTRKLKELGIGVFFMNDNINTLEPDAELRLTIMSSIAQEESRKTSERVKWGQKRRMEQGVVFGRDMLGYDVRNGKLIINEKGAEIVRLIFHKFVNENKGTHVIARELREEGIETATYMKQWSNTTILRILRNEKYCGDLIQKKTYTPSYLNHEKKYNYGEEEFVIIKNHHEPIISSELFDMAQNELRRRSPSKDKKSKHTNRYCFSGKIKCGICGSSYVSRSKKRKDGSVYRSWRCYQATIYGASHIDNTGNMVGCCNHSIGDEKLKKIIKEVMNELKMDKSDKDKIASKLIDTIESVLDLEINDNSKKLQRMIEQLNEKKQSLLELYLNKDISRNDFNHMAIKLEFEIEKIQTQLKEKQNDLLYQTKKQLKTNIIQMIENIMCGDLFDDTFYQNIIEKIIIYPNQIIELFLKQLPVKFTFYIENN